MSLFMTRPSLAAGLSADCVFHMEMHPGQPWWTAAEVEHWHGAAPDEDVLQLTIYSGSVNWMEPVSDEVYKAPPGR